MAHLLFNCRSNTAHELILVRQELRRETLIRERDSQLLKILGCAWTCAHKRGSGKTGLRGGCHAPHEAQRTRERIRTGRSACAKGLLHFPVGSSASRSAGGAKDCAAARGRGRGGAKGGGSYRYPLVGRDAKGFRKRSYGSWD